MKPACRAALVALIFSCGAALPGLAQQLQHAPMPPSMAMPGPPPLAVTPGNSGLARPARQASTAMPGMNMDDVYSKQPFRPGLGDLMTAFVQPRHIKLGLAGAARNWDYAAYERDELQEAFDDIGKLIVKHGDLAIPSAIAATVKPPLDALDAAITAKDEAAFAKAYGDLTTACNACHQSAGHPIIAIQVPTVSGTAFPDQDFNPPK